MHLIVHGLGFEAEEGEFARLPIEEAGGHPEGQNDHIGRGDGRPETCAPRFAIDLGHLGGEGVDGARFEPAKDVQIGEGRVHFLGDVLIVDPLSRRLQSPRQMKRKA